MAVAIACPRELGNPALPAKLLHVPIGAFVPRLVLLLGAETGKACSNRAVQSRIPG